MYNIICVNVGTKYPIEYTKRLYNMVERNINQPFKFYVYTDQVSLYNDTNINTIEHKGNEVGWWCKLNLFKPGVLPKGNWLYFDLDVVIVDDIQPLLDYSDFAICRDFIRPNDGLLPGKEYNSSVMKFNSERCEGIYQHYINNVETWKQHQEQIHFFGDQNVISNYLNYYPDFCNPFPDELIWSYKKGVERGKHAGDRSRMFGDKIPEKGIVCVFHGNPDPTGVNEQWVKKHYV